MKSICWEETSTKFLRAGGNLRREKGCGHFTWAMKTFTVYTTDCTSLLCHVAILTNRIPV